MTAKYPDSKTQYVPAYVTEVPLPALLSIQCSTQEISAFGTLVWGLAEMHCEYEERSARVTEPVTDSNEKGT